MTRFRTLLAVLALSLSPGLAAACAPEDVGTAEGAGDAAAPAGSDVSAGMLESRDEVRGQGRPDTLSIERLGHTLGESDAPVRVIEFSDFGCGYCRQFHEEVWPTLLDEYVEAGKVEWKHIPMILGIFGKNADEAAEASLCAREQGGFDAVKHRLFADQRAWKGAADPLPVFEDFVREEGLGVAVWKQCMASDRHVPEVQAGTALSRQVGVRGTPTFFIVGVASIPGMVPLETFREVLDTVHAQATR